MGRSTDTAATTSLSVVLVVALIALAQPASASRPTSAHDGGPLSFFQPSSASPPWFCHRIDCPEFKPVAHTKDYDTRAYPAGLKWTSTVVTGMEYDAAVSAAFMKLFKYISGENADKAKVPMTAPVRVRVTPGAGPFCESNFTVSFFVPFVKGQPGVQIDPPEPTSPAVFSETDPSAYTVYARSFGGRAEEKKLLAEAAALAAALEKDGKGAGGKGAGGERESFFFAGYDSPFRVLGRHNEVWYAEVAEEAAEAVAEAEEAEEAAQVTTTEAA
jgi:hypothetical protein